MLNELYKERCSRRKVQTYSELASSLSHELEEDEVVAVADDSFRLRDLGQKHPALSSFIREHQHPRYEHRWTPISKGYRKETEGEGSISHPP